MNRFVFHKAGQGLFYSGHLFDNSFRFVYDCGTRNSQKELENEIDDEFEKDAEIDFIVVSHLHYDHISRLQYLINRVKRVKKLFLPFIEDNHLEVFLNNMLISSTEARNKPTKYNNEEKEIERSIDFIDKIYRQEKPSKIDEVFFVRGLPEDDNFIKNEYSKFKVINSPYIISNSSWNFILFNNLYDVAAVKALKKELNNLLVTTGYYDLKEYIKNKGIKKAKEIYEKHFKDLNNTSIILLHYPKRHVNLNFNIPSCQCIKCYNFSASFYRYFNFSPSFPNQVLTCLTGDLNFDEAEKRFLTKYLKKVPGFKIFQVPHHGSEKNWESMKELQFSFDLYVISHGESYSHPNKSVLMELIENKKTIRFADKKNDFMYWIH